MIHKRRVNTTALRTSALIRHGVWFVTNPPSYAHSDWHAEAAVLHRDCVAIPAQRINEEMTESEGSDHQLSRAHSPQDSLDRLLMSDTVNCDSLALDVGLSLHRTALLGELNGAVLRKLEAVLGNDRLKMTLNQTHNLIDRVTALAPLKTINRFSMFSLDVEPDLLQLNDELALCGARALLAALDNTDVMFFARTKMRWPRTCASTQIETSQVEKQLIRNYICNEIIAVRFSGLAWLF